MQSSKEVEYAFFGSLFKNAPKSILEAIELRCSVDWFSEPCCRLVWRAIENINAESGFETFNLTVVFDEAQRLTRQKKTEFSGLKLDRDAFANDAFKFCYSMDNDLATLAQLVRNNYIGRQSAEIVKKELLGRPDAKDNSGVVTACIGKLSRLVQEAIVDKDIKTTDLLRAANKDWATANQEYSINKNYDYSGPGLQSPWALINKKIGNYKVGLNIIAARPSVGKTSFALQLVNFWCHCGYKVGFDCLDMACSEIIKRIVMSEANVSLSRAELGMMTADEAERVKAANAVIEDWGAKDILRFRTDYDVDEFIAWCKLQKSMGKLDVVVIDYVQQLNMRGYESCQNENIKLQEISKRLKALALTQQIPVILLAQLNRDAMKGKDGPREPEIADIRGSGALEQDAYTITILHRDDDCQKPLRDNVETVAQGLVPPGVDDSSDYAMHSLDTIWVLRKKSQNGSGGRFPMVVYNPSFLWFLGDMTAPDAAKPLPKNFYKFAAINADYRFNREPFLTAERNGQAIFPKHWPRIAERICKRMGWAIPDALQVKIDEYNREHTSQPELDSDSNSSSPEVPVTAVQTPAEDTAYHNYVDTDLAKGDDEDIYADVPF